MEIRLNSNKNINSVNKNVFNKIELINKPNQITEYDIRNILSATDIFDAEREENSVYSIYGKIEYLSLLNGLSDNYQHVNNFFVSQNTNSKNIYNSFDWYLLRPSGYTNIPSPDNNLRYVRLFEVIATPENFEIFNAGFTTNLFGEQEYSFTFNKNFDVSGFFEKYDNHPNDNIPTTELFLYPVYKTKTNGSNVMEKLQGYVWNNTNSPILADVNQQLILGDIVYGDIVEYSHLEFYQSVLSGQTYHISTSVNSTNAPVTTNWLVWNYNPFIPLRLRYFSDSLNRVNTGTTSYDALSSIPAYATNVNNGNFVWRDILPQGYFDPLTEIGVDYPFVNKKRYLFLNIVFQIIPDLLDEYTLEVFTNIKFAPTSIYNYNPTGDLNNIGKPCQ